MWEKYEDCPACNVRRVDEDEREDDVTVEIDVCGNHRGSDNA